MIKLLNQTIQYFEFIERDYKGQISYGSPTILKARIVNKNINTNQAKVGNLTENVFTTTCTLKKPDCKNNDKIIYNGQTYYVKDVQEWLGGLGQIYGNYLIIDKDNV